MDISVIVPAFNEENNVEPLYERLKATLIKITEDYEVIFVDDGSTDLTAEKILDLRKNDSRIKLVSFSRNFGHEMANTAGFRKASGNAVVIIDADLQDPPELIIQMYEKLTEGYDVIYAQRRTRNKESFFKKLTSKLFYRILKHMSDISIPLDTGDYRMLSRRAVDSLNALNEKNRFFRGLTHWIGFKVTSVYFDRDERHSGETKYSYLKLMSLATDAIMSFSYKPLKIFSTIGIFTSLMGFVMMIYWILKKIIYGNPTDGWTSIVTILLFFFGLIIVQISLIGEYIARIYEESRDRPLYIIGREDGFDE